MKDATDQSAAETPVGATRVARRSLILAAVVCRGSIDAGAGQPEAESLHNRIPEWLTELDLWDEVEPSEEKILHTPLGGLAANDVIRATWYAEGLAVLAWALNRLELPRHDEKVDPYAVTDSLWFLSEDAAEVISTARLRSPIELEACRELLYAIHCRLRDFARNRGRKNFTSWVEKTWMATLGLDAAHLIVHDDLAIDDKVISEVENNRLQECEWVTCERHRAIIWLLGGYPIYSQTPVDT
jgi:hypothetical protein